MKVIWHDGRKNENYSYNYNNNNNKNCLKKRGLKKEKIPKRHLRGWIASPCVATLNRRRRICRRLAVGLTTRLSWQHKKSWTNSTPDGFGLLLFYCSLLWVDNSWLINEPVCTRAFSATIVMWVVQVLQLDKCFVWIVLDVLFFLL